MTDDTLEFLAEQGQTKPVEEAKECRLCRWQQHRQAGNDKEVMLADLCEKHQKYVKRLIQKLRNMGATKGIGKWVSVKTSDWPFYVRFD